MIKKLFCAFILIFITCELGANAKAKLKTVELSQYGDFCSNADITLSVAINDIEGKRLILPDQLYNVENIIIKGKKNFAIVGSKNNPICCKDLLIQDCSDFEISNIYVRGTKDKFATFYIKGDCSNFSIHDCLFDSEKGTDGRNQFYGIHVISDTQNPKASYENSPRHFRIYNNVVKNTKYDGILAHAHCSNFVIEKNTIIGVECIGIEVEGRYGGATNTTVHPCKNAVIRNNVMKDCGDWNVLLMWTDNVKVYGNRCYNGFGSFLSIGCTNLIVKNNILEGLHKGFELSNEFFRISNGINNHALIKGNVISGKARAAGRGVLDIRHSQNVAVKGNKVASIYRDNSAMISVASSKHVAIAKNHFMTDGQKLQNTVLFNNVPDYETKIEVPFLNVEDVKILNNTFIGVEESIESKGIVLSDIKCVINNKYKL